MTKSSRREILVTIIGVFLIMTCINVISGLYLSHLTTNKAYWLIAKKWELLLGLRKQVDWLIVGDSTGNQGIVPGIIEQELKGSALNLCTTGNMTVIGDALMAETYVRLFGVPKNLVIVHTYDVWHREFYPTMLTRVPLPWGYWRDSLLNLNIGYKDAFMMYLSKYFPLYSENISLSNIFMNVFRAPTILYQRDYVLESNGYMKETNRDQEHLNADIEAHRQFVANNRCRVSPENKAALLTIIRLAADNKINVYIVNGPLHDELVRYEPFQECFSRIQEQIRDTVGSSRYVRYIDRLFPLPSKVMQNADHVIHPGAIEYSQAIVSQIKNLP